MAAARCVVDEKFPTSTLLIRRTSQESVADDVCPGVAHATSNSGPTMTAASCVEDEKFPTSVVLTRRASQRSVAGDACPGVAHATSNSGPTMTAASCVEDEKFQTSAVLIRRTSQESAEDEVSPGLAHSKLNSGPTMTPASCVEDEKFHTCKVLTRRASQRSVADEVLPGVAHLTLNLRSVHGGVADEAFPGGVLPVLSKNGSLTSIDDETECTTPVVSSPVASRRPSLQSIRSPRERDRSLRAHVVGHYVVDGFYKPHVEYTVLVKHGKERWTTNCRFSRFIQLHAELVRKSKGLLSMHKKLPRQPKRITWGGCLDPCGEWFLDSRQVELEKYLGDLLDLQSFLGEVNHTLYDLLEVRPEIRYELLHPLPPLSALEEGKTSFF